MISNEQIAHVCHEANRALQLIAGEESVSPEWGAAPQWQRESAIEGVQAAIDWQTPQQLHESWCEFKVKDGWVYGEAKDATAKTHPCLLPYSALPAEQIRKDLIFAAIVRTLTDPDV